MTFNLFVVEDNLLTGSTTSFIAAITQFGRHSMSSSFFLLEKKS